MSPAPDPASSLSLSDPPLEASAAHFLLGRIDYERTPPVAATTAFKLCRMQALLEAIGNPQLAVPCIHIAGSKGKGSTAAMLASILTHSGHRTGLFTSPHIERFEERIQLDGVPIPSERLAHFADELRPVVHRMEGSEQGGPTFFELTTAIAWMYFREVQAEVVVLEVGLGGRLDATNLCRPWLTLITSISRDHTRLLGERLEQIAGEKAGIIKPRIPVLTGVQQPEPLEVIRRTARDHQSECYELGSDIEMRVDAPHALEPGELPRSVIGIRSPWRCHFRLQVPLPGEHQARNTALAVAACDWLNQEGSLRVSPENIEQGLAGVRWPLRIEAVRRRPLIILDAAHNEASIAALIETLRPLNVGRRVVVFSASQDKDVVAMLRLVGEAFDDVILTRFLGNPRAYAVEELVRLAPQDVTDRIHTADSPAAALRLAQVLATPDDLICVTGSFFLAGEVRALLRPSV